MINICIWLTNTDNLMYRRELRQTVSRGGGEREKKGEGSGREEHREGEKERGREERRRWGMEGRGKEWGRGMRREST